MKLIEPTDAIDVDFVPILIYGGPSLGKTTLGQTAEDSLTLDFDQGIHRAGLRQKAGQFDSWDDVVNATSSGAFGPYKTLVVDTLGRCLDLMQPAVLADNAKNGYRGNLSPQGWGVLGSWFGSWMKTIRSMKKQLVLICHEEEDKKADGTAFFRPDMPGKMSYKEVHKWVDLMARMYFENGRQYLDFCPSEVSTAKNGGQLGKVEIPDLKKHPRFLADLIARAKANLGRVSAESAATLKAVKEWDDWLSSDPNRTELNERLPRLSELSGKAKRDVWEMVTNYAKRTVWVFNPKTKQFEIPSRESPAEESPGAL